jgi:arylsulfatase A-like enzyme
MFGPVDETTRKMTSLIFATRIWLGAASILGTIAPVEVAANDRPNVILIMADDLGWGDTGYNGNPVIRTPQLDRMAAEGLRMDRFYAACAVCSPTRASCLTGRNPYRTGVFDANNGILRPEEVTLPEILHEAGYINGHFGKWHLGTLTATEQDANRGRPGAWKLLNPPREHGYDVCFVTESKVPTWDPMKAPLAFNRGGSLQLGWPPLRSDQPFRDFGTHYWNIEGRQVTDNLDGDDSRVIMDRVLPFIDGAVGNRQPFLAVIWFHAPHLPCVAGPEYQALYEDYPLEQRNYAGCITAMDRQIGRLRDHLNELGVARNTMIWFCSDNGPEGRANGRNGSAANLRGRKRDLYEGGVRVPGLLVWPARIREGRRSEMPCATCDYLPTVLDALDIPHPRPEYAIDGVSLMPLIEGTGQERGKPLCLMFRNQLAVIDGSHKLLSDDGGQSLHFFDLQNDREEKQDLAGEGLEPFRGMSTFFLHWHRSVQGSFEGAEYGRKSMEQLGQTWNSPLRDDRVIRQMEK